MIGSDLAGERTRRRPGALPGPGRSRLQSVPGVAEPIGPKLPFFLFLSYMISFYLHFGERFPTIAVIRPDLVLAILVLMALVPYLSKRIAILKTPTAVALTFLVAVSVLSLPFVEWPGSVLRHNLAPFLKAVLFFYFTVFIVDTPGRLKWFVFVFVSCQLFRVFEPLYLNLTEGYLGGVTHLGGGEFAGRLNGAPADVINPNELGFVVATTTVLCHFLMWRSERLLLKLLYAAFLPALLYTLILTMSRGAFLALLVGGWLVFLQSDRKFLLVIVAIGIGIGGWSVMSDVQKDRYLSLVSEKSQQRATAEGRMGGMISEIKLGLNRPIFGHGLGTTPEAKANIRGKSEASHNLYAELLIELGVVGLAAFMVFMIRIRRRIIQLVKSPSIRDARSEQRAFYFRLAQGLLTVFWVYAVYSLNYFGLSQSYWYVLGGLALASASILNEPQATTKSDSGP